MSRRQRPFYERLRRFEDVLQEVSRDFAGTHRFTPVLDVDPPRVVSVAVQRTDLPAPPMAPTVYVPVSDRLDTESSARKAALRRRLDAAIRELAAPRLALDPAKPAGPARDS